MVAVCRPFQACIITCLSRIISLKALQQQEQDEELKALSLQDYRSHRYMGLIRNLIRLDPTGDVPDRGQSSGLPVLYDWP